MTMRPYLAGVLLLLVPFLLSAGTPSKNMGKRSCVRCHAQEQKTVLETPHDSDQSCESCHGSGEQHLKSGGDPASMFSFVKASADEVRAKCNQCHQNPVMNRHAAGDVSCISCHSAHHYARKKHLLRADDNVLEDIAHLVRHP
jgi:hypothetical protein